MPILDFKEIPLAHVFDGYQDAFELFAREVLALIGYEIVESPSRGADGGKDLIVSEPRTGVGGKTVIKWLVSCKHAALSKRAIGIRDEASILERVKSKNCQGFIGFYSTLPSSALALRLHELKKEIETQWFDREKIESELIKSTNGVRLAKRYFPKSIRIWETERPKPAKLGVEPNSLHCEFCGKDLLKNLLREIEKKGAARLRRVECGAMTGSSVATAAIAATHHQPGESVAWLVFPEGVGEAWRIGCEPCFLAHPSYFENIGSVSGCDNLLKQVIAVAGGGAV